LKETFKLIIYSSHGKVKKWRILLQGREEADVLKNYPGGWFSLQVRMAAFTLLMLSDPPEYVWQNIAIRTWFEPRSHVTSFIYTTLETLASFQSPVRFLRKL
jgi:Lipoprotein amino terminal region